MTSLRQVPLSGDKLVDWIFKQFVIFLERKTVDIQRKKRLKNNKIRNGEVLAGLTQPKNPNKPLRGTDIFINSAKCHHLNRSQETKTLIHELAHNIFPDVREEFIHQMERMLTKRLTSAQMNLLKSYIPRAEVKK